MRTFRRILIFILVAIASSSFGQRATRGREETTIAHILGPNWLTIVRSSGMIFSGTVLGIHARADENAQSIPIVEIAINVDTAIVGVRPGEALTIREWAGAWSQHPVAIGDQLLLFLHPRSRLGLTSPVGGTLGQFRVKAGNIVLPPTPRAWAGSSSTGTVAGDSNIPINQLMRAVNRAREE